MLTGTSLSRCPMKYPSLPNVAHYLLRLEVLPIQSAWLDPEHLFRECSSGQHTCGGCSGNIWVSVSCRPSPGKHSEQGPHVRTWPLTCRVYGNEAIEIKIWTFLSNLHSSSRKWEPFRCHCSSQGRADLELNPSASQGDGPNAEGAKSSKSQLLQGCPCQSCHPLTKGQEVSSPEGQWGQQLLSLLGRQLLTLAQQTGWSGHWALTRKPRGPGKELVWTYSANRQQTGKSFEGYGKCSRGQWSEIQNATTLYYGN